MALTVVGLFGLFFIASDTPIHYILLCLVILGIGFAFFSSPNVNAIMSSVDNKFYGIASATQATMRLVGQMLSMGVAMLVFVWIIGNRNITHENGALLIASAKIIFGILTVTCLAGVAASLARGRLCKGNT